MKKNYLFCYMLLTITESLMFLSNATSVSALENNKNYTYNNETISGQELKSILCPSEVGTISFPNALKAGSKDIELYCVYSDKDAVLKEINQTYRDTINYIKNNYNIANDLNNENWQEYRNAMINVSVDDPNVSKRMLYDIANIDGIFDIYENDETNAQITSLVSRYNSLSKARSTQVNSVVEELDSMIPNYSDNFGTMNRIQPRVGKYLNVQKASEYANRYATSRNKAYHYFNNGDCTNFMSQILEYSGVSQVVYESEHLGWWHTNNKILGIFDNHKHSRSWTMADTFSRYMGVTVRTTSISTWAEGLNEGDFVALDKTNDGSWDHMGYVTAKSTTRTAMVDDPVRMMCINIPDIKIAQHTSDYNAWLSSSTNGWETYYTKAAYGRIRG